MSRMIGITRPKPGSRPSYPRPEAGPCWICKGRSWTTNRWQGKSYCWRHHPRARHYPTLSHRRVFVRLRAEDETYTTLNGNSAVHPNRVEISKAKEAKLAREVDAKLGRKKTKPPGPRKPLRDRRYVR